MSVEEPDQGGFQPPRKEYTFQSAKPEGFMVENAQWERLRTRVDELERQPSVNWLSTAAWAAFSLGISALLALVVLPGSDGTRLGANVKPTLWAITIAGFVLAAILTALYFRMKRVRAGTAKDICNEMDTIHEAWKARGGD